MVWSGWPKTIGLGHDLCYNRAMTKHVQKIMSWLESLLQATEIRWLVLVLSVFWIMVFYAVGLTGLGQLTALIYIMYFVTFWRTHDR